MEKSKKKEEKAVPAETLTPLTAKRVGGLATLGEKQIGTLWCAGVDDISAMMDTGQGYGDFGYRFPTDYLNELKELADEHNEQIIAIRLNLKVPGSAVRARSAGRDAQDNEKKTSP